MIVRIALYFVPMWHVRSASYYQYNFRDFRPAHAKDYSQL